MVSEKNVTDFFFDADADDARRRRKTTDSDSFMLPPLKRAGDTKTLKVIWPEYPRSTAL